MTIYDFGDYVADESDVDASIEDVLVFFIRLHDFPSVKQQLYTLYKGTQEERNLLNEFTFSMIGWYLEATEEIPKSVKTLTSTSTPMEPRH